MNFPILMYHKIQPEPDAQTELAVTVKAFQQQMETLKALHYQPVRLADLVNYENGSASWPRRPVAVTFDDAFTCVEQYARPVLEALGFFATVFVVSECVGGYNRWDAGAAHIPRVQCLDQPALLRLARAGWELGSHSATHANLTELDSEKQHREIAGSKADLESRLGLAIPVFCCPYGAWNPPVGEQIRQAGYLAACATSPGTRSVTGNRFGLRRVFVKPTDSLAAFKRKISSWYLGYRAWRKH